MSLNPSMASGPGIGRTHITSLVLWGGAHGKTRVNRLPIPSRATVTWSSEREDTLTLQHLDSGMARDVFISQEASYVIKLQAGKWHESSNAAEALLGESAFAVLAPQIYGSICTSFQGVTVSVLVAERVEHTFQSWCDAVVQVPPGASSLKVLVDVTAGFFKLVVEGAGNLGFQLKDLHWNNLGITHGEAPPAQTRAPNAPLDAPWKAHMLLVCAAGALPGARAPRLRRRRQSL